MAMRKGQTQRQAINGKYARNANNKRTRAAWQKDSKSTNADFPKETCNGKKNRQGI